MNWLIQNLFLLGRQLVMNSKISRLFQGLSILLMASTTSNFVQYSYNTLFQSAIRDTTLKKRELGSSKASFSINSMLHNFNLYPFPFTVSYNVDGAATCQTTKTFPSNSQNRQYKKENPSHTCTTILLWITTFRFSYQKHQCGKVNRELKCNG